ncbi:MAG: mechanosensitive ion channel family protein [Arachnia sp.]
MTDITQRLIHLAIVLVGAIVLRFVLAIIINRSVAALAARAPEPGSATAPDRTSAILSRASGVSRERQRQRVTTLGSLMRNVVDVAIGIITLLTMLAIVGIPMAPLLASAGVGGVAIGFGAQSLVKDYLSGIFMLAEDQFGVGDIVAVGEIKGTVLEVTLRVTKVRDFTGVVWYVRNGEILTLGNISQGFSVEWIEIPVAIDEDPDKVIAVLRDALQGMSGEEAFVDVLMNQPEVLGVDSMSGGTMIIKLAVQAHANQHWAAVREVRRRAQEACTAAGIRKPLLYPSAPQ